MCPAEGQAGGWPGVARVEGGVLMVEKVQGVKKEVSVFMNVERSAGALRGVLVRATVGGWWGESCVRERLLGFFL